MNSGYTSLARYFVILLLVVLFTIFLWNNYKHNPAIASFFGIEESTF